MLLGGNLRHLPGQSACCAKMPCCLLTPSFLLAPQPALLPLPPDNVIRAGLTPKLRDVETLCSSLTYGQGLPELLTGAKAAASQHLAVYRPPFRCVQLEGWQLGWAGGCRRMLWNLQGQLHC